ncbi:hypothetical protein HQ865_18395 [Mucilaginibacter mali]|uniref:Outer membrane protein beta-barrel domain-containing protein n=1 Tax=Mucilaginibacter mali TaxID=2740462 RepID=A0A7D4QA22_9SPHI|nr:hypothetical protein [Mucilaginibacter mali]QKJ31651.1 hypothetical protein HQ865_18395 [Mucilaginibacter mali]
MKKSLTLFLLLAALAITANAQKKPAGNFFNLAIQGAMPVSNNEYNFGIGISGQFEIPVSTDVHFTAGAGYISLQIKDSFKKILSAAGDNSSSHGFIPVQIGIKYFLSQQFYAAAQTGAVLGSKSGTGTAFIYSPGLGCVIPVQNGNAFDIGVRYEGWAQSNSLNFIGVHAAFKFGL